MIRILEPIRCRDCRREVTIDNWMVGFCPASESGHQLTWEGVLAMGLRSRLEGREIESAQ